jgi:histidinol-phosphatase (PHP family)
LAAAASSGAANPHSSESSVLEKVMVMIGGYYAVDFQVHSLRSHDGKVSILEMCKRAAEIGLDEIGFTEHKDFDPGDPVVDYFDYAAYMSEIEAARSQWGDRLKIRAGVEIDYQLWFETEIARYLEDHPFDYVLGSVHYVNRVTVMSDEYNRSRNAHSAYADYFSAVLDSVESGMFDVLGHLEYANRRGIAAWGPYNMHDYEEELSDIFNRMVEKELTLEINTAGIFHGTGSTYPTAETVALFVSRGGDRISIGSDAHHPDQLGGNYTAAVIAALAAGVNSIVTWSGRQARLIALESAVPSELYTSPERCGSLS